MSTKCCGKNVHRVVTRLWDLGSHPLGWDHQFFLGIRDQAVPFLSRFGNLGSEMESAYLDPEVRQGTKITVTKDEIQNKRGHLFRL